MTYDLAVWEGPTPRSDEQAAQVFTELSKRYPDRADPPDPEHSPWSDGPSADNATRQIAMRNTDPADSGSVIRQFLNGQLFAVPGPWVTPTQVQKACEALDEFTTSLEDLNRHIQQPDAHIDTMAAASARLWESNEEAAPVH
ncbi:MAG: hypothetical protein GY745_23150, partial [Actinomycetia bacterium]|nr:hypothetical protein [Actinomycetes bacterium]